MDQKYSVRYTLSKREEAEGFQVKNVLASYIHLHFLSCPGLAEAFVANAVRAKQRNLAKVAERC